MYYIYFKFTCLFPCLLVTVCSLRDNSVLSIEIIYNIYLFNLIAVCPRCYNSGTCAISGVDAYKCTCLPGSTGETCKTRKYFITLLIYYIAQVTSGKITRCDWLLTWHDFSVMTAGIMKIVNAL